MRRHENAPALSGALLRLDRELRARYARLMSRGPVSPFEFLRQHREKQRKMKDFARDNAY
jgi:hypothetical protein